MYICKHHCREVHQHPQAGVILLLIWFMQVSARNWPGPVPYDTLQVAKDRIKAAMDMNYKGMLFWSYGGQEVTGIKDLDTGKFTDFEAALRI